MERKSKAMAALACMALLALIGAGCARCTMVHAGQQEQAGQEQSESPEAATDEAKGSLEELLGSKWTSRDGKSAMSIVNGAFVERCGSNEEITYWTPEKTSADEGGFSESIWVSDSLTETQSPSIIRVDIADDGSLAATCDSFKLATSYVIDAPESAELSITGNVGYLASLANVDQAKIAECLQAHAGAKCPYAKAASWDGEIFIDANAERISSTFTLDDTRQIGVGYLKNFAAVCIAGLIIVILMIAFPLILGGIVGVNPGTGTSADAIANGLTYALQYLAMCILLILSLVKSGAWARDIVSGF